MSDTIDSLRKAVGFLASRYGVELDDNDDEYLFDYEIWKINTIKIGMIFFRYLFIDAIQNSNIILLHNCLNVALAHIWNYDSYLIMSAKCAITSKLSKCNMTCSYYPLLLYQVIL